MARPTVTEATTGAATTAKEPVERPDLRAAIEGFLFREAELLDDWRLQEWLDLFAPDGRYVVPATDHPGGDPTEDLVLVHDDRPLLEQRVASLLRRSAHAEYPHSRTRRLVTNVMVSEAGPDVLGVRANFAVYRMRSGRVDDFIGHYRHRVDARGGRLLFLERKAILDHESLDQGKLSIIL